MPSFIAVAQLLLSQPMNFLAHPCMTCMYSVLLHTMLFYCFWKQMLIMFPNIILDDRKLWCSCDWTGSLTMSEAFINHLASQHSLTLVIQTPAMKGSILIITQNLEHSHILFNTMSYKTLFHNTTVALSFCAMFRTCNHLQM